MASTMSAEESFPSNLIDGAGRCLGLGYEVELDGRLGEIVGWDPIGLLQVFLRREGQKPPGLVLVSTDRVVGKAIRPADPLLPPSCSEPEP